MTIEPATTLAPPTTASPRALFVESEQPPHRAATREATTRRRMAASVCKRETIGAHGEAVDLTRGERRRAWSIRGETPPRNLGCEARASARRAACRKR